MWLANLDWTYSCAQKLAKSGTGNYLILATTINGEISAKTRPARLAPHKRGNLTPRINPPAYVLPDLDPQNQTSPHIIKSSKNTEQPWCRAEKSSPGTETANSQKKYGRWWSTGIQLVYSRTILLVTHKLNTCNLKILKHVLLLIKDNIDKEVPINMNYRFVLILCSLNLLSNKWKKDHDTYNHKKAWNNFWTILYFLFFNIWGISLK
jgi:hypothetical protein